MVWILTGKFALLQVEVLLFKLLE